MNARDCARRLLELGAVEVRTDPEQWFTWASGRRAPIYCDNRLLISYPEERSAIARALADATSEHHPDVEWIAGTATAGIPWAAWVAERLALPMVYVRGAAKEHGRGKRVEGRPPDGERVVLIEDLISLGGSAAEAALALQEEGAKVIGVQTIVTWALPAASGRMASLGIPCHTLTSYDEILEALELSPEQRSVLLDWRDHF